MKRAASVAASASFSTVAAKFGAISTGTKTSDTFTDVLGGKIVVDGSAYTGTANESVYFTVKTAPTAAGSVTGLSMTFKEGVLGTTNTVTATGTGATETFTLANGVKVVVTLGASDTLTAYTSGEMSEIAVVAASSAYVKGKDYTYTAQDLRAGIIRIKEDGAIKGGDTVLVSASIPEKEYINISMFDAGDIKGRFLYNADNNNGPNYVVEGWSVKLKPSGDLSGLIGKDFGTYKVELEFLDDSMNHPDFPMARCTMVGYPSDDKSTTSSYRPQY